MRPTAEATQAARATVRQWLDWRVRGSDPPENVLAAIEALDEATEPLTDEECATFVVEYKQRHGTTTATNVDVELRRLDPHIDYFTPIKVVVAVTARLFGISNT